MYDPMKAPVLKDALLNNNWGLFRVTGNTACSKCGTPITRGDAVWIRKCSSSSRKPIKLNNSDCEILHNMNPCKDEVEPEVTAKLAKIIAKAKDFDTDKEDASIAVARIAGISSLVDFIESESE